MNQDWRSNRVFCKKICFVFFVRTVTSMIKYNMAYLVKNGPVLSLIAPVNIIIENKFSPIFSRRHKKAVVARFKSCF